MAPESLTRTPVYSSKSDIWSFGIVAYEIFSCGQKPWPEKPVKWIATKIRKGITAEMPKRMPRLIREIIAECFHFEPEQRPTFRQVSSRIHLVQGIRFIPPHPLSMSLARIKNVKPTRVLVKDPDAILVEFESMIDKIVDLDDEWVSWFIVFFLIRFCITCKCKNVYCQDNHSFVFVCVLGSE
ncbi:unnamed protein product [Gongylonema pulchrum]|uniref:Protein kinase domain-containing protein n=1 Tax=Gongylonema pulchrum TaxID=637853 RepID=A0A183EL42_9BILA|nr:unnamed protein product [Gongylonema pulchrum]